MTTHQLKQYIKLLPPEYQMLDVTVKLYANQYQLRNDIKKWRRIMPTRCYKHDWTEVFYGVYYNEVKLVLILVYNIQKYKNIIDSHSEILYTLYHELRHAKQYKERSYHYENIIYRESGEAYINQWIEKDANEFGFNMILNHRRKILQIQGIEN